MRRFVAASMATFRGVGMRWLLLQGDRAAWPERSGDSSPLANVPHPAGGDPENENPCHRGRDSVHRHAHAPSQSSRLGRRLAAYPFAVVMFVRRRKKGPAVSGSLVVYQTL